MRSHDLKFRAAGYGFITLIPVLWFGINTTKNYYQIWIFIKDKFKMLIKIFKNVSNSYVLAGRPKQTIKIT